MTHAGCPKGLWSWLNSSLSHSNFLQIRSVGSKLCDQGPFYYRLYCIFSLQISFAQHCGAVPENQSPLGVKPQYMEGIDFQFTTGGHRKAKASLHCTHAA